MGKYRNQEIDAKKVAGELNVDTLLTGTFVREGESLRITAQLIDVTKDKILWKLPIDLKYDRLLTVQDTVAQEIIKGLELNLTSSEVERFKRDTPINPQRTSRKPLRTSIAHTSSATNCTLA